MTGQTFAIALRLAAREVRGGLRGFRVFLACLILGVGAVAAVGSIAEGLLAGLAQDARKILGGDLAIRLVHREIDPAARDWLAARGVLSRSAYLRTMAEAEGRSDRTVVELKAVDDRYPLFGAVGLTPNLPMSSVLARAGTEWGAAVDPSLLDRLGLAVGGRIRLGEATYVVRAVIGREPDRAGNPTALMLGPRVLVAADSLHETGLIRPGSLVTYVYGIALPPNVSLASLKADLAGAFPQAPWFVRDRNEPSPTIQRFIERTALFMAFVGLSALLIGGVGVGNAAVAYLGRKTEAIATLKCLGAERRFVFQTYLLQMAAMAAVGVISGLAIGVAAPFVVAEALPETFPVSLEVGVFPGSLAVAAATGVLIAAAFSLAPLARAAHVRPSALFRDLVVPVGRHLGWRVAAAIALISLVLAAVVVWAAPDHRLAAWFVVGAVVSLAAFRLAAAGAVRLARLARHFAAVEVRLALAGLGRPGAPTASIVTALGLGLTVLVAVASIDGNFRNEFVRAMPDRAPALYFIDIQPNQVAGFEAAVRSVDGVEELRRTPMLRGRMVAAKGVPIDETRLPEDARWIARGDRGVTWSPEPLDGTRLVAGSWWPADYRGPPLISLAADAAAGLGVGVGDELTVDILGRKVSGQVANLRAVDWQSLRINFVMVFSPGILEGAPQTHLATVRVPPEREAAVERAVADRFRNVTAIRVREVIAGLAELFGRIGVAVQLSTAVAVLAGVLVLAGAVAAENRRRVYEAVVLKVIGATRREVAAAYLIEHAILGLGTAAIAAGLGSAAAWAVTTKIMRIQWIWLPEVVAATALGAAAVALLLGFAGIWQALRQKAAPHMRNP
jgi:putative ABC transport system permease protein